MKALFYTATAVFISLAAVIAYFALQPPTSMHGVRVVLDIDTSAMPETAGGATNTALDPYAGEEDKPLADENAQGAAAPEVQHGEAAAQQAHSAVVEPLTSEPPAPHSAVEPAPSAAISAPPPGTALAGLEAAGPLFREIEARRQPDQQPEASASIETVDSRHGDVQSMAGMAMQSEPEQPAARVSHQEPTPWEAAEPRAARRVAGRGEHETGHAPDVLAAPGETGSTPNAPASQAPSIAMASPPAQIPAPVSVAPARPSANDLAAWVPAETPVEEPRVVAPPPPPIPVRKPNNFPPEDRTAATGNSWSGVQYAATDSAEASGKPPARVALLLRGIGRHDPDGADTIGSLPSAISLGFWPYAAEGQRLATRARERGHEVIVQLPLEPNEYPAANGGPDTLLTSSPPEENAQRLQSLLQRFEGASGVTNLLGSKMLHAKAPLKPVLEDLKARGLLYLGESSASHATVREVAREVSLRYGAADVQIDAQSAPEAIDKALARLVSIARQRGSAIGIGNATAITVQQVHVWSETLGAQGISLVPVGALAQTPGSS